MQHSKSSLIVLAVFFSSISLFAQTDSLKCNSQIQFHLINGYSLSYLNLLSSSTGLRFKADLGFGGSTSNLENVQNNYSSGSSNSGFDIQKSNEERSSSTQSLNFSLNYFWFANIIKEIKLYVGIGPMIGFSRYSNEYNQGRIATSYYNESKYFNEATFSSIGIGFQGVIGIECPVTEKISLLAEFNLSGTYSWDYWKNKSENQGTLSGRTESTINGNSWNYGLNNLKIGIAYNF